MVSVPNRLGGLAAALVVGCASANPQPSAVSPVSTVSAEPRSYAIQNLTSCFARVHSMNSTGTDSEVLAEVRPGQQAEVTLAPNLRLIINTHRIAGMNVYDEQPRRATDFDVIAYTNECRKTGQVVVRPAAERVS